MRHRNKYGARQCVYDGYVFDSQAEMRRYIELSILLQAGHITGLTVHAPTYTIHDAYKHPETGNKIRAITYTPDFTYTDLRGVFVVEDVKGKETEVFRLKRKLFEARYGIAITVVKG